MASNSRPSSQQQSDILSPSNSTYPTSHALFSISSPLPRSLLVISFPINSAIFNQLQCVLCLDFSRFIVCIWMHGSKGGNARFISSSLFCSCSGKTELRNKTWEVTPKTTAVKFTDSWQQWGEFPALSWDLDRLPQLTNKWCLFRFEERHYTHSAFKKWSSFSKISITDSWNFGINMS